MQPLPDIAPRRHKATAHLPIADCGNSCEGCKSFMPLAKLPKNAAGETYARGRCRKWAEFRGRDYTLTPCYRLIYDIDWWRGHPAIDGDTAACKYFTPKDPRENVS